MMIGYVTGGFDLLHDGHREYIKCILDLARNYSLSHVVLLLQSDEFIHHRKGGFRPFFKYEWRRDDILSIFPAVYIECVNHNYEYIDGVLFNIKDDIKSKHTHLMTEIDGIHTTSIENMLIGSMSKSHCNLRKVGAVLIRNGMPILCGSNASGISDSCLSCDKFLRMMSGYNHLSIPCTYKHAEEVVLLKSLPGDDLLITTSPCQLCAELIVKSGIKRVVYIDEYRDSNPIEYMKSSGILVRKAGL